MTSDFAAIRKTSAPKATILLALAMMALGTSACATLPYPSLNGITPTPGTPPTSSAPHSAQGMPQSPNSLPPGARVNAPIAAPTGAIETTRVW